VQDLAIVYRYSEDLYLLSADGGLIDTYRNREQAETAADHIRALNLAGYTVRGENPRMEPGYQYGRVFIEATIGPKVPNPYALRADGPAPIICADELPYLPVPRDVMGRALDFLTIPYALIHELRQLDPDDRGLLTAAARYDSASAYRDMIRTAQGDDPHRYAMGHDQRRTVAADNLSAWIATIADLCKDDGADRGFIPLIGGSTRAVWMALYRWYTVRRRPGMGAARLAARVSF
jgi:hypothetical protein